MLFYFLGKCKFYYFIFFQCEALQNFCIKCYLNNFIIILIIIIIIIFIIIVIITK